MERIRNLLEKYQKILYYLCCSCISLLVDVTIVSVLFWLTDRLLLSNTIGLVAGFLVSYLLSVSRVFASRPGAASFAVYLITFLMGTGLADFLISSTYRTLIPVFTKQISFLISKGISTVVPFFFMYFIRKGAFAVMHRKR